MTKTAQHEEAVLQKLHPLLAKAEVLRQKGRLDDALRLVNEYANDHFDDVAALTLAGNIFLEADKFGMVHVLMKRATELEPKVPELWNNLGICYQEGTNLEEGEMCFHRALKLNPNDETAHLNLAQLYVNLAQKHANKSIEIDPSVTGAYYNRALANLMLGNFRDGWADYDAILGNPRYRKERSYGIVPRWNGVDGKAIIAHGEQGIGDELAFSSCIPDLAKNNKVIIECTHSLYGLFKRSFGLETHGTRQLPGVTWLNDQKTGAPRKIDASVAFGSLPQHYRNEVSEFPGKPYLIADPERRLQWRALLDSLGPKMKVGIAWTGGNKNTGKERRSLGLDDLLPILRQDATFISLQYMDAPEILDLERDHGIKIHHWKRATQTEDYDDTAALVAELDLVITVQTAVVHLSGALGQECWAMLPKTPRWFYGITGTKMPWYESVKLYRQRFKWVELISDVAKDLRERISPTIKSAF